MTSIEHLGGKRWKVSPAGQPNDIIAGIKARGWDYDPSTGVLNVNTQKEYMLDTEKCVKHVLGLGPAPSLYEY